MLKPALPPDASSMMELVSSARLAAPTAMSAAPEPPAARPTAPAAIMTTEPMAAKAMPTYLNALSRPSRKLWLLAFSSCSWMDLSFSSLAMARSWARASSEAMPALVSVRRCSKPTASSKVSRERPLMVRADSETVELLFEAGSSRSGNSESPLAARKERSALRLSSRSLTSRALVEPCWVAASCSNALRSAAGVPGCVP